ncbi:MAG: epoxyqueuosine reductase QueH [Lachnospiraceae bacterium]|nr:epoxyqueuosine reductase QueH [Lachnospiraceae bacterium]
MNAVRNYQKELDKIIDEMAGQKAAWTKGGMSVGTDVAPPPRLLLHSCCAPCSSYVLEYLRIYFRITVFYYNPNISREPEYRKRVEEQKRLIMAYNEGACGDASRNDASADEERERISVAEYQPAAHPIAIVEGDYEPERFYEIAKGLEQCPEGGERCFACYEQRLGKTAELASAGGYDYFATTLTISPLKNAAKLNEIGEHLAGQYHVKWLPSDFKKKGGYQRSIVLSKEYDLYRQDYCGCIYSEMSRRRDSSEMSFEEVCAD